MRSVSELEVALGEGVKALRLLRNIDQKTLAERAGVSVSALRNLETGAGATVKTLAAIVRALGRDEWLGTLAPVATVNPLTMPREATRRQRATGRRKTKDPVK